ATVLFTAHAFDQAGAEVGSKFTWLLGDTTRGSMQYNGTDSTMTLTPAGIGSVTVTAIADNGVKGTATVTVSNVAPTITSLTGPGTATVNSTVTINYSTADANGDTNSSVNN